MQHHTGGAPVYGYRFTYTSPYAPIASHLVDVPFVFGTLTPQFIVGGTSGPSDADRALSEMMMAYWVNFAANGNPNGTGLPPWPAYQPDGLVQNFGQTVIAHRAPETARFRFLASFRVNGILPAAWRSA